MVEKRIDNFDELKLVAEFFSNVAVAWFAAGVIGVFVGNIKEPKEILISLLWGITYSGLFLFVGAKILKGVK